MSVYATGRQMQAYAVETTGTHTDQQSMSADEEAEAELIATLLVQLLLSALRMNMCRSALESNACRICCHVLHAMLAQHGIIGATAAKVISEEGKQWPAAMSRA